MHDPARVRITERIGARPKYVDRALRRKRTITQQQAQRSAREESHAHPGQPLIEAGAVDRHDVRVLELRDDARFVLELMKERRVVQGW